MTDEGDDSQRRLLRYGNLLLEVPLERENTEAEVVVRQSLEETDREVKVGILAAGGAGISNDGRLIAVAGRRGLIHYSASSGRWKMFAETSQEQAFGVKGGLLWFHHVLIAAIEVSRSYQASHQRVSLVDAK